MRAFLTAIITLGMVASAQAAPLPQSRPQPDILQVIMDDAQAALDDANQENDKIAAACYGAIIKLAKAKQAQTSTGKGRLIYGFQKVRDITRLSSSQVGQELIIGCAPLVQDAKLNMVTFFTQIGGLVLIKGLLVP